MTLVRKRDGIRLEEFDKYKIVNAILGAVRETYGWDEDITPEEDQTFGYLWDDAIDISEDVYQHAGRFPEVNVKDIERKVETSLMEYGHYDVARNYILYRYEHDLIREKYNTIKDEVSKKLKGTEVVNDNANLDENTFSGRYDSMRKTITKEYALSYDMSEKSAENHRSNYIYIHDLDAYDSGMHNCLSIPIDKLLKNGYWVKQCGYLRSPHSISTACQLCAVIMQCQSQCQFGGVSYTHLDWTLVPYFRRSFYKHWIDGMNFFEEIFYDKNQKAFTAGSFPSAKKWTDIIDILSIRDDFYERETYPRVFDYALEMTLRELEQAAEGLLHNLNSLQSRPGAQLPFSSINMGSCTLEEGQYIINAFLDALEDGVGENHQTSVFPCFIFQLGKDINLYPGTPNHYLYRKALRVTSKRIYPNYANLDWSGNEGYDKDDPKTYFSTMGCRTANGFDVNGMGMTKDGRGNICPVTIILPTVAARAFYAHLYRTEYLVPVGSPEWEFGIKNTFIDILAAAIDDAKDMLIERFNYICSKGPECAPEMWKNGAMEGYDPSEPENIWNAMRHGTLAIGQLGLSECLQLLIGKDHQTPEGMEFAKRIEELFQTKCKQFKELYSLNFGVYYTPAESLCGTAMTKFKETYPEFINGYWSSGTGYLIEDKEYFTNSIHVPVSSELTPFEKIDIEAELVPYSSAGCITYVELGGEYLAPSTLETLVTYAMEKDIPYFAINVDSDLCNECGYDGKFKGNCPRCGSSDVVHLARVTGYLSTSVDHFNNAKKAEVSDRVKHDCVTYNYDTGPIDIQQEETE